MFGGIQLLHWRKRKHSWCCFIPNLLFLPSISCLFDRITQIHKLKLSIKIIFDILKIDWKKNNNNNSNSRRFATPPLVIPLIDIWGTSAENPYFYTDDASRSRITSPTWVVFLIGSQEANFKPIRSNTHDLGNDTSSQWNSALVSQTSFGGKNSGGVSKCRLFSQVIIARDGVPFLLENICE